MSNQPFEELTHLDRLVQEPARLAILTALASCESAESAVANRLDEGNLNTPLTKLEHAKLVAIEKTFRGDQTLPMLPPILLP